MVSTPNLAAYFVGFMDQLVFKALIFSIPGSQSDDSHLTPLPGKKTPWRLNHPFEKC